VEQNLAPISLRPSTQPVSSLPPARPGRTLTPGQIDAVRAAMQIFVEDDLHRGITVAHRRWCVACAAHRPSPGFVTYEQRSFCHPCATAYELARLSGAVSGPADYLQRRRSDRSA
jgi:hypothetical protein